MTIAFVGLGIMGSRMAANLLEADHPLVVHNRTRSKAEPLLEDGAAWAGTPMDAARDADVIITMLGDPGAVEDVALGDDGFLAALPEGALWINSTTVNPSFARRMNAVAIEHGVRYLDAPVAGTRGPADEGTLLFLVGGEEADVQAAQPLIDDMGRGALHVGEAGHGSALKMLFNLLLGTSMAVFAESIALGTAMGLDREMLLDTLIDTPVVAPFVGSKREMFDSGDYEAHFPLRWQRKDLHLALQSAYEQDVAIPTVAAAEEQFTRAQADGLGDQDFAALLKHLMG